MDLPLVLVVDDHADTCQTMEGLIQKLGYRSKCVATGAEALAFLDTHCVNLIILDQMIAGTSGIDVLLSVRAHELWNSIPVIMHTALTDEWFRTRAGGRRRIIW